MKVEVWSDVLCPFCYIGKRRLEKAIEQFEHKDEVEVVWRSFQLDPSMEYEEGVSIHEYLAERKGISLEQAKGMNEYVTQMAEDAGLEYHLDKAVPTNSFDAHRLSHLALEKGVQHEFSEKLFQAYFTNGLNTGDHSVLTQIALSVGLNDDDVKRVLTSDAYASNVREDIQEAAAIGARGVPFFVFERKYAVSGAQNIDTFLKAIQQTYAESKTSAEERE